jgi:hypothetical protein
VFEKALALSDLPVRLIWNYGEWVKIRHVSGKLGLCLENLSR